MPAQVDAGRDDDESSGAACPAPTSFVEAVPWGAPFFGWSEDRMICNQSHPSGNSKSTPYPRAEIHCGLRTYRLESPCLWFSKNSTS